MRGLELSSANCEIRDGHIESLAENSVGSFPVPSLLCSLIDSLLPLSRRKRFPPGNGVKRDVQSNPLTDGASFSRNIPCKFPCYREFRPETGTRRTGHTTIWSHSRVLWAESIVWPFLAGACRCAAARDQRRRLSALFAAVALHLLCASTNDADCQRKISQVATRIEPRVTRSSQRLSASSKSEETFLRHVLFICSRNRLRSPTAEHVFSNWPGIDVSSAGLNPDAENPVTPELLEWADLIFVMERAHRNKLSAKFRPYLNGKRIICLGIPDDYDFMDPVLIRILKTRVSRFLPSNGSPQWRGDSADEPDHCRA